MHPGSYDQYGRYIPQPVASGSSGKATAALVLGICGIVVCPIIPSIVAIVLGHMAKGDISQNPEMEGRGMAQAGFILGIVGLALWVVGIIAYIVLIVVLVETGNEGYLDDPSYYDSYSALLLTPLKF